MVLAYVLIATKGSEASRVAKELTKFDEVDNIHLIYGEYDIIARVKASNLVQLRESALEKIGKLTGVGKMASYIVADMTKPEDNVAGKKTKHL